MTERSDAAFCMRCGNALKRDVEPGARPTCTRCGHVDWADPKVAAGVVVERFGKVILVRRSREPMYGQWSFPSGFVDAGEIVEEAAAREVLEETGVTVSIQQLLGVFSSHNNPVIFVAYAGIATSGEPRPADDVMETGLFSPDALPELAFPHDSGILDAWHHFRNKRL